ncbi:MAG: glycosyltransferase [Actinobacteria bacterium]|nr:glycosyltransferase [Actinomycetota bacterium]
MQYDLSIVIPCYNEEKILEESVNELEKVLKRTIYKYELIFIDDYSHDSTTELIKKISKNKPYISYYFHNKNIGRGGTVCEGIKKAKSQIVGFLDIDLEVHARYLPSMVQAAEEGYDIATAHRISKFTIYSLYRNISHTIYHWITKYYLNIPLNDTEAGFKFFNRQRILPIIDKTINKHWFWDTEVMAISYFNNLKIKEIPCLFIRRKDKKSTVRPWQDCREYINEVLKFKFRIKELLAIEAT